MAVAINRTLDFHILNGATKLKFPSSDIIGHNQYISTHGIRHEEYNSRTIREHKQQFVCKSRRHSYFVPFASANDNITPNGVQQKNMNIGMEEFSQSEITGLVQSIHDAARYVELAICKYSSSSKTSWFSKSWLGVDKDAWIKTLSYQVSVYALLQAAIEISSRGERGDQDTNIFVKRSLLRQCTSLENVVREELSTKQQELYEWYWSHQHNMVLKMYIDLLEKDPKFSPATMLYWKGESSVIDSDASLVLLALSCLAAIKHLGSAKVSCSPFFSMLPDTIGRLMDLLVDFVAIQKTYDSMRNIGLRKEFLFHFGPRAASIRYNNDNGTEEIVFWINLVQNQLKMAIDREKIWSRLTTSESIEVLEKDLAIFGFFIALGKSTKSFLSTNGVPLMNDQIESIIRFLIGGSVLYYPQLSSISSYQMYVEVVCEELEWLPFYPSDVPKDSKPKVKRGISNKEALSIVLDVCAYWMTSFIKYSTWLENPSNIKATRFLSKGHSKLIECMKDVGISEMNAVEDAGSRGSEMDMPFENELDYFDKALESVEEALNKLEILLQELHLSNSNTNTDDLKAACSDLERLRKLKKEAEFLEASLRAKAALLGQGNLVEVPPSSTNKWIWFSNKKAKESESAERTVERSGKEPFWRYLVPDSSRKNGSELSAVGQNVKSSSTDNQESELDEIRRFELLRRELIEVEKRVQKSTDAKNEEELEFGNGIIASTINNEQKKDDVIAKSIEKIKETSTDVLQGTQLLAIDVAAAMGLLRRAVTGDELAEKEKKALQRTLTDLASVVPIGVLMLLPVTAVGHAAILAAIQRYAPSLIPSTYGPERLDLLRQLEKVKETEIVETSSDENKMNEVINSTSNNNPQ